jgi:hypothetical protein
MDAQAQRKPGPKGKRRELAPQEDHLGTEDGPKMKALPNDRWRAFVLALYEVRPGHGARVKAAKLAGFGCETSTPQTMTNIANRLLHDERILEAINEVDGKRIRGIAPRGVYALERLIENPNHRDHARAVGMLLDRVHPAETTHTVKVQHDAAPDFKETAQVLERIALLAAKFNVRLPAPSIADPAIIDGEFSEVGMREARR